MSPIMIISSDDIKLKGKFRDPHFIKFQLEIDPQKYFYPNMIKNEFGNEKEDLGLTDEQYENIPIRSRKIKSILESEEYKSIFATVLYRYLKFFIKTIEREVVRIFERKSKDDKTNLTSIEKIVNDGPLALRYIEVLEDVTIWCNERDNKKLKLIHNALKKHMGVKRGPVPFPESKSLIIIKEQRKLEPDINILKKDSKSWQKIYIRHEEISKRLDLKYSEIEWYKALKKKAEEKNKLIATFILRNSVKKLICTILARKYCCFERTIEEVYRQKSNTIKKINKIEFY